MAVKCLKLMKNYLHCSIVGELPLPFSLFKILVNLGNTLAVALHSIVGGDF